MEDPSPKTILERPSEPSSLPSRRATDLPAVAVRAMVDAPPPELEEAGPVGELVEDPGGEHELARRDGLPALQGHLEGPVLAAGPRRPLRPVLDAGVGLALPAPDPPEF